MDLVIDIWVKPDRSWEWKDRDDYQQVLDDHTLNPAVREGIDIEAAQVLDELEAGIGPFAENWLSFRPPADWPRPRLPETHAWGGSAWSLPLGRRLD